MAGDDAGFDGGDARFVGDGAAVGDAGFAKARAQGLARFVIADQAEGFDARAERSQVCGDVASAAEAFTLFGEIDDGNGGFGGEAGSGAPEVAVEHEVAEDADAAAFEFGKQALEARQRFLDRIGHAAENPLRGIIRWRWKLLRAT